MSWPERIAELERRVVVLERKLWRGFGRNPSRTVYWGDIVDRPFSVHYCIRDGAENVRCIGGNISLNQDVAYDSTDKTVADELYTIGDYFGATETGVLYVAVDCGSTSDADSAGYTATTSALSNTGFTGPDARQYYGVARVTVTGGSIASIADCLPWISNWTPDNWTA